MRAALGEFELGFGLAEIGLQRGDAHLPFCVVEQREHVTRRDDITDADRRSSRTPESREPTFTSAPTLA